MGEFSRSGFPGPIPNRWLKCPRKSTSLVNRKFLVFKTPLSSKFDEQISEADRFPVDFVFMSMASHKVKMGLWIDLTNTSRFYAKSDVENHDCRYVKIQCKGRGETPTQQQTRIFIEIADKFIRQHPLEIIGVHCTHGFNRSGFMIISYLIEKLDWGVQAALAEFAKGRQPGIYKQDYIDELFRRYDDIEDAVKCPPMPLWCLEEGDGADDSDGESPSVSASGSGSKTATGGGRKRRPELEKSNPVFMEGIQGVVPVTQPLRGIIQRRVQELCSWEGSGFPGCQPISLDRQNIYLLEKKPYHVSWKADGVRYLMYIRGKDEVFCLDRDNTVFQVNNLSFPYRKNLNLHINDTLVDGEMVMDKVNGRNVPRFLIYDMVTLMGTDMRDEQFAAKRYKAIQLEIVDPRLRAQHHNLIVKSNEPFSVRRKDFWDVREGAAAKILSEKFARTLSHEPDGLIFQPSIDPYFPGRCDFVLKWKPPELNSIDFRLKITMDTREGAIPKKIGELYVGKLDRPFGMLNTLKNVQHLNGKIIECRFENNKWIFMRERTDKSIPNSFDTAKAVFNSIVYPVTKEFLLDFIERHPYLPPPTSLPPRMNQN